MPGTVRSDHGEFSQSADNVAFLLGELGGGGMIIAVSVHEVDREG